MENKGYTRTETVFFGILLAIVGGFMDAYTFMTRGGAFAYAQTGNIIKLGISLSSLDFLESLNYIFPIIAFILGVVAAESIRKAHFKNGVIEERHFVLLLEAAVFFLIGFVPASVPDYYVNVAISFVASVQYCFFRKIAGTPYASTMCTGNLRSAVTYVYEAFTKKEPEALRRAGHLAKILTAFCFGALASGVLGRLMGVRSIWVSAAILAVMLIALIVLDKRDHRD